MIYFRFCFSFICSDYGLTLIKKSHILNFYLLFLLVMAGIAQFTVKTTNSKKDIYFLSLISWSINKLKSRNYSHVKVLMNFYVFRFNVENFFFAPIKGEGTDAHLCPPFCTALLRTILFLIWDFDFEFSIFLTFSYFWAFTLVSIKKIVNFTFLRYFKLKVEYKRVTHFASMIMKYTISNHISSPPSLLEISRSAPGVAFKKKPPKKYQVNVFL